MIRDAIRWFGAQTQSLALVAQCDAQRHIILPPTSNTEDYLHGGPISFISSPSLTLKTQKTTSCSVALPSVMAPTDLENLLDMGFEKPKAELALKKSGNCKLSSAGGLTALLAHAAHERVSGASR